MHPSAFSSFATLMASSIFFPAIYLFENIQTRLLGMKGKMLAIILLINIMGVLFCYEFNHSKIIFKFSKHMPFFSIYNV